ncbi:hypothetical protein ABFS83_07G000500 [Erythranthe nasuta]
MESKIGGEKIHKSMEWDSNEWRWDGALFVATPLNSVPLDCMSRQLGSDELVLLGDGNGNGREKRDFEKRTRGVFEMEENENEDLGLPNLKLGGQVYPIAEMEGKSGKKTKVSNVLPTSSRSVCQVEDCRADLSNAKDYHRRHKVCDLHSKSTSALVGDVMQRFCQQCSRFHVLQEFDEGKRSCRRRLAGHNKRRRKTHPENDEPGSNYLLISLLRILSNIHSNSSDQIQDQDLVSHLLKNLAHLTGTNPAGVLPVSQNVGTSLGTALKGLSAPSGPGVTIPASDLTEKRTLIGGVSHASTSESPLPFRTTSSDLFKEKDSNTRVGRTKLSNIDLNCAYDGSQDCMEDMPNTSHLNKTSPGGSPWLCKDSQRCGPPQNSGNSASTSSQSPSTSSGEAQSRTDRIVFKLFGKDPSDFPLLLRKQILDWLSDSPTDIESYIRPGCIILTIYLRMEKSSWDELYCNLTSSLLRLLNSSTDSFWRTGWIYTRVHHHVTFMYNGQVVLDTPLPVRNHQSCRISSIKPIAVPVSEGVHFVVKGFNLSRSTSRLLCALEGKYLVQENCADMTGRADSLTEHDQIQSLTFSCAVPNIVGRGFIEIEDHGLSSSFFPFIVAEKDVCSEICTLESVIEDANEIQVRNEALDFIHEMGWLLQRNRLKSRLGDGDLFPFERFRRLTEFSIDHDWCAVVKKLLRILFDDGTVDLGPHNSNIVALLNDVGLVHRAVRRKCSSMVEFLLNEKNPLADGGGGAHLYLFRPDAAGPGGLTPLHIAASLDGCENVLDALTEDPGSVGIEEWKRGRDSSGLTAHDYACIRGQYSYINIVQRKVDKKSAVVGVGVDIGDSSSSRGEVVLSVSVDKKMEIERRRRRCGECEERIMRYGNRSTRGRVRIYRPAMLSLVGIAAVCVCTALLFKSSPEVLFSFRPFIWDQLKYGSQ